MRSPRFIALAANETIGIQGIREIFSQRWARCRWDDETSARRILMNGAGNAKKDRGRMRARNIPVSQIYIVRTARFLSLFFFSVPLRNRKCVSCCSHYFQHSWHVYVPRSQRSAGVKVRRVSRLARWTSLVNRDVNHSRTKLFTRRF